MIRTNVEGLVRWTNEAAERFGALGSGTLVGIGSVAGDRGRYLNPVYNASKAFDQSWAEAVRNELKDTGVTVTALQPGATDTNFFERADLLDTKVGQDTKDDPADVARDGFEAMLAGKDHVVAHSLKTKLMEAVAYVTPETVKAEQHRKMAEPGSANK